MKEDDLVTDALGRRTAWTAKELLADVFPEPRYAVEGLLPEGATFFAGAPKLGKSWLALGLGIAVASGGRAFGEVPVEAGEVAYLALEDSARRLKQRMQTLLGGDPPPEGLFLHTEWPRLDDGGYEQLEAWLGEHPDARLVIIDVWPRIRPRADKSADHYQADYDAAAKLQGLAIHTGVAVVALYHTRKAEANDFVETVQGTFGTAGAADTIVVVKRSRGQADATLHVTGRDVEERELALRFSGAAGTWSLLGDAADWAMGEARRTIREVVKEHGDLTPKQVGELTGILPGTVRQTMSRMAKDGQLVATSGVYSIPRSTPVTPVTDVMDSDPRVTGVTQHTHVTSVTGVTGSERGDHEPQTR